MKIIHCCPLSFHFSLNWFSMCYSLTCVYFRVVVYVTFPEHSSSSSVFIEVHVAQPLFFCLLLCKSLCVFFVLAIMLSVFLRFAASDYPLCIFKLFFIDKI